MSTCIFVYLDMRILVYLYMCQCMCVCMRIRVYLYACGRVPLYTCILVSVARPAPARPQRPPRSRSSWRPCRRLQVPPPVAGNAEQRCRPLRRARRSSLGLVSPAACSASMWQPSASRRGCRLRLHLLDHMLAREHGEVQEGSVVLLLQPRL